MADITLVRQLPGEIPEKDRESARRVLFGIVDGLGEQGKKRWRRFVNALMKLEPGEMVDIRTHKARSGPFHRRHMLIETRVFEAQERIKEFEDFRLWLKLGAGHVTWMAGAKGGVVPVPKSISYAAMEEHEMEEFHAKCMEFLRSPHAIKYLWPHMPAAQAELAIEAVLTSFNE